MKSSRLAIPEVILFDPAVFEDERGLFFESFRQQPFDEAVGYRVRFVQENHSVSRKGALRGLHFQFPPYSQGKLVRVIRGAAYDVAVDLRAGSGTYGQWTAVELTAENRRQLWIPEGFAHGFLALEEGTELVYKTTAYYDKNHEGVVNWRAFDVPWPLSSVPTLSERDANAPMQIDPVFVQ